MKNNQALETYPRMIDEIQRFKWQGSKKIYDEPTLEVMHSNHLLLGYDSARFLVDVCCAKVDENIDNEEDFDDAICYDKLPSLVVSLERHIERDHYGNVADEN